MPAQVRTARHEDLTAIQGVEVAAGALFATVGMDAIAEDDPPSLEELADYQRNGRAWVSVDDRDVPVGYLLIDVVDGNAHVEQVTVHPAHARRGRGRELLDVAEAWAAASGRTALTLTTFADVEWNAPYYRRLGFRDMTPDEVGDELRAVRVREAAHGLDAWPRVSMVRPVRATSPSH
ncbi:GNAT family N-acetyltransferase [Pseudokineococcus basanitobsidens]|uniref:GNAT family N-acetyltransferase n=1 Tax=Pseudokineococcus basanitobsidens TaxID=1926649 RepID=A0ABU8RPJ8_9ACTN